MLKLLPPKGIQILTGPKAQVLRAITDKDKKKYPPLSLGWFFKWFLVINLVLVAVSAWTVLALAIISAL